MDEQESPLLQDLELAHTKEFWAVEDELPKTPRTHARGRHARKTTVDVPAAIVALTIGAAALAVGLYATPSGEKPSTIVRPMPTVTKTVEVTDHAEPNPKSTGH